MVFNYKGHCWNWLKHNSSVKNAKKCLLWLVELFLNKLLYRSVQSADCRQGAITQTENKTVFRLKHDNIRFYNLPYCHAIDFPGLLNSTIVHILWEFTLFISGIDKNKFVLITISSLHGLFTLKGRSQKPVLCLAMNLFTFQYIRCTTCSFITYWIAVEI